MKVGSCLSHSRGIVLLWCLFIVPSCLFAASDERPSYVYSSAIQNSKFTKDTSGQDSHTSLLFRNMGEKKSKLLWKLGMEGESLASSVNLQSQTASFGLQANFRTQLMDTLSVQANGKAQFQAGRTQDLFGDLEPDSGLYLKEAVVKWDAVADYATLKAGVLNQGFLNYPLLVSSLGFPGVRETFAVRRKRWHVELTAQQLIPTSSTLSTRVQEKEKTPTFYTETLEGQLHLSNYNWLRGRFTLFNYNDLPNVVAYRSQILGNTFQGGNLNNAQFKYDFDGWLSQLLVEQKLSHSVAVQLGADILRNTAAEDRYNESQRLHLNTSYDSGAWIYSVAYETFFIEPDASPSYYNDFLRGNNNRIGWGAGLSLESKRRGFRVGAYYYDAKLLNKDTALAPDFQQDDLKTIMLNVETSYEGV